MLKLDILVPIILILCLIALAYILSEIFKGPDAPQPEPREIVLDPSRYTDETAGTDTDGSANVSNTPGALDGGIASTDGETAGGASGSSRLDDYYDDDDQGGTSTSDTDTDDGPGYDTTPAAPNLPRTDYQSDEDSGTTSGGSQAAATTSGRYLVIAGSFRQKINAQSRVRNLRSNGFSEAEVGYTNRGAYAVALVEATTTYGAAQDLAARVSAKGYEVFIKERR